MNTAIPDDVDTELSRYLDAEEIRGAGIKPEQLKIKQIQYDKQRGVNNVLMRLPSGGYTKIGEEKVVDPVPPQDVGKQPPDQVFDEATAAWTQPDRTAEIRAFQQEMPRVYEDYLAAGFTEPELQAAGIAPALPPGAARPQMTPEEVAAAGTGTIEPRDLTIREGHTDVLRQIFEGVGADPFFARQLAESVVGNPNATRDLGIGLADLTPLGAVYGGQEGYQTFTRGLDSGDNVTAALGALEAGLSVLEAIPLTAAGGRAMRGAIPGIRQTIEELGQESQARIAREGSTLYSNPVGPVVDRALAAAGRLMGEGEQAAEGGIRAYHGSPYTFERFDMSKIGTGEGAQAYGRGLYFAESEGVARSYRDALSRVDPVLVQERLNDRLSNMANEWGVSIDDLPDIIDISEELAAVRRELEKEMADSVPGRLYEVRIAARPADFLDWDRPLSEQPKAEAAIGRYLESILDRPDQINEDVFKKFESGQMTGADVVALLGDDVTPLREAGIVGVRYLDQGSRAAGEGTRNYVVFDDALIDIVKRYGIAGLMVGAGVQAELGVKEQIEGGI